MLNYTDKTIREIAVAAPATTRIFEEFKIDYCCGGGKTLSEACAAAGVAPSILSEKLEAVLNSSVPGGSPEQKTVADLIDYIVDKHHVFTRTELSRLSALLDKVAGKHGGNHPELNELREPFMLLYQDLIPHMNKEEMILFPYIQKLVSAMKGGYVPVAPPFGSVTHPIQMMCTEHDEAGNILKKMRAITNDYIVPDDACPSYRALYFGLDELEKDLHQHIHLENNVLFIRAVDLEKSVFSLF